MYIDSSLTAYSLPMKHLWSNTCALATGSSKVVGFFPGSAPMFIAWPAMNTSTPCRPSDFEFKLRCEAADGGLAGACYPEPSLSALAHRLKAATSVVFPALHGSFGEDGELQVLDRSAPVLPVVALCHVWLPCTSSRPFLRPRASHSWALAQQRPPPRSTRHRRLPPWQRQASQRFPRRVALR